MIKRNSGSGVAQPGDLVNALSGGDDSQRVRARQHLPAFGVEAIQALIPLTSHENLAVSKPARDVLMDIANEVCAPGRDTERREACDLFISMIAADQPHAIKVYGLKLLAMVVPNGFDVKPIADLLADEEYREKARVTLERIGTQQSRRALRAALRRADAEFTCALLASLGSLSDSDSTAAITKLASHKDVQIRLSAAHALAQIGDPGTEAVLIKVVEMASNNDRADAIHSLLLFAELVVKKRDDKATARRIYRHILDAWADGPLQNAALAELRAVGDI